MKFIITLFLLSFSIIYSQDKEKIKGSKIVTSTPVNIGSFENIDVTDNFDIYLVKDDKSSIEIEADDNLHDVINYSVKGNLLQISSLKKVISSKKFAIRIHYTDSLLSITGRDNCKIYAQQDISLPKFTITQFDKSESFINARCVNFNLFLHDNSESELNTKGDVFNLEATKSSEIKALVICKETNIISSDKSRINIEGDADLAKIKTTGNSKLVSKKFPISTVELVAENYSNAQVNATKEIEISSSGKTEIELLGNANIHIKKFTENATLKKSDK